VIHIQKILYPTDFSSYSNQAYFHAISQAEKHGASLTVVFVYNPAAPPETGAKSELADHRAYWRQQLETIRPLNPGIEVEHALLEGDPAAEIVRFAHESGSDLIIMGTHGRTGMDRILMGSVAEKVLREARCSVMVVKLPRAAT
jgi:nucleotide-binding universal stress UspA family protein